METGILPLPENNFASSYKNPAKSFAYAHFNITDILRLQINFPDSGVSGTIFTVGLTEIAAVAGLKPTAFL